MEDIRTENVILESLRAEREAMGGATAVVLNPGLSKLDDMEEEGSATAAGSGSGRGAGQEPVSALEVKKHTLLHPQFKWRNINGG